MNERQALDLLMRSLHDSISKIQDAGYIMAGKLQFVHPKNNEKRQIVLHAEITKEGLCSIEAKTFKSCVPGIQDPNRIT